MQGHVWKNVSKGDGKAEWMSKEPSNIEMERAIQKMKLRKSPGKGGVVAEVLKYGGEELKAKIFDIVRQMWRAAAESEDGNGG